MEYHQDKVMNFALLESPNQLQSTPTSSIYFSCDSSISSLSEIEPLERKEISLAKKPKLLRKENLGASGEKSRSNYCQHNLRAPKQRHRSYRQGSNFSASKSSSTSSSEYFTTASSPESGNWPEWVKEPSSKLIFPCNATTPSLEDFTLTENSETSSFICTIPEVAKKINNSKIIKNNENKLRVLQLSTTYSYMPKLGNQLRTFTIPSDEETIILMDSNKIINSTNKSYASPEILILNATAQEYFKDSLGQEECTLNVSLGSDCDSSISSLSEIEPLERKEGFLAKKPKLLRKENLGASGQNSRSNFCKHNLRAQNQRHRPNRQGSNFSASKSSSTSSSEYFTTASSPKSGNWPEWVKEPSSTLAFPCNASTPSLEDFTLKEDLETSIFMGTGPAVEKKINNSKIIRKNENKLRVLQLSTTYSYMPKLGNQLRTFTIPSDEETIILMDSNKIINSTNKSYASPEILILNATAQDYFEDSFGQEECTLNGSSGSDCKIDLINFDYATKSDHVKIPSVKSYFN